MDSYKAQIFGEELSGLLNNMRVTVGWGPLRGGKQEVQGWLSGITTHSLTCEIPKMITLRLNGNTVLNFYLGCFSSVQFSSVPQSCPTLRNPMNCSTPGLPVHHQLLEFTQTHIHPVGDAIQPSHPLSSPSPPAPRSEEHTSELQSP